MTKKQRINVRKIILQQSWSKYLLKTTRCRLLLRETHGNYSHNSISYNKVFFWYHYYITSRGSWPNRDHKTKQCICNSLVSHFNVSRRTIFQRVFQSITMYLAANSMKVLFFLDLQNSVLLITFTPIVSNFLFLYLPSCNLHYFWSFWRTLAASTTFSSLIVLTKQFLWKVLSLGSLYIRFSFHSSTVISIWTIYVCNSTHHLFQHTSA